MKVRGSLTLVGVWLISSATVFSQEQDVLVLVSPQNGQAVCSGDLLALVVDVDPVLADLVVTISQSTTQDTERPILELSAFPYESVVTVPGSYIGPLSYTASVAKEIDGELHFLSTVSELTVVPCDQVVELIVPQTTYRLELPAAGELVSTDTISVDAVLSDGKSSNLNFLGSNVVYTSLDPSVVTVDKIGNIDAVTSGQTFIKIEYEQSIKWVFVMIGDDLARGFPVAENLSSKLDVSYRGFRLDPADGYFVQRVGFSNNSNAPLPSPWKIVLENLTDGVEVVNRRRGLTTMLLPVGSDYVFVEDFPSDNTDFLVPGATMYAEIRFLNIKGLPITYTPIVYTAITP